MCVICSRHWELSSCFAPVIRQISSMNQRGMSCCAGALRICFILLLVGNRKHMLRISGLFFIASNKCQTGSYIGIYMEMSYGRFRKYHNKSEGVQLEAVERKTHRCCYVTRSCFLLCPLVFCDRFWKTKVFRGPRQTQQDGTKNNNRRLKKCMKYI